MSHTGQKQVTAQESGRGKVRDRPPIRDRKGMRTDKEKGDIPNTTSGWQSRSGKKTKLGHT